MIKSQDFWWKCSLLNAYGFSLYNFILHNHFQSKVLESEGSRGIFLSLFDQNCPKPAWPCQFVNELNSNLRIEDFSRGTTKNNDLWSWACTESEMGQASQCTENAKYTVVSQYFRVSFHPGWPHGKIVINFYTHQNFH